MGIKTKIIAPLMSLVIMVIGLVAWQVIDQQNREAESRYHDQLASLAVTSRMMIHSAAEEYANSRGMTFYRAIADGSQNDSLVNEALTYFRNDPKAEEFDTIVEDSTGATTMFAYAPAYIKDECITCHSSYGVEVFSGMKTGDLSALFGISASLQPLQDQEASTIRTVAGFSAGLLVVLFVMISVTVKRTIGRPLSMLKSATDAMSNGDFSVSVSIHSKDEIGSVANSFNYMAENVQKLMQQVQEEKAGVEQKIETAVREAETQKEYLSSNVQRLVREIEKIADGDLNVELHAEHDDDIGSVFNALLIVVRNIRAMLDEISLLSRAAVDGKLSVRANAELHHGDYRKIVQGVNDTLDSVIRPLNVAAEYVDRISKGDIPVKITDQYNGDFNEIKNNLNQCIDAVNALVADAAVLSKAATEGKLSTRADASKHGGDFRKIVQGVNDTLDSVIRPLNVAAKYVDDISKGNIPSKITDTYNGDFNAIKDNLNTCIDAVNALVADAAMLSRAAVDGKLSTRADASNHGGDFRKIVQGVNDTLDSVIGPLNVAAKYVDDISKGNIPLKITDQYNGDFNAIKENLNTCIDAVNALVADANMLAVAAVEGRLNTRADAAQHQGDFRKIVQGVNDTLDAVILPVQEGAKILAKMSEGDLTVRVVGEYQGDHQLLKNSINTVGQSLNKALLDVTDAVEATASASSEISSSTEQMAAGSQEQSSQAGEVAAAVEEMTRTIMENSKNALGAVETAKNAKRSAEQGGKVVEETVAGMKRIAGVVMKSAETVQELGRSSEQIGEIISVIDDIADQTNLLALNAAIEAARAGDQGRGFAVVADEVRKLAERTTKATKEIAVMIKKIQADTSGAVISMEEGTREVNNGISLADKAGTSLHEIVSISQTVTDMITQIATASEQQTSTSEQISKNVEAISTVTAETASGTQQVARAAEDLNRLTENLQQLVSRFTITDENSSRRSGKKPERRTAAPVQTEKFILQ
jgi:methyl-accepting chemotaxis protein